MVKLNKIYTRTGDDGTTGLVNGERRLKHDARIAAFGEVDEANSAIGLARLHVSANADLDAVLAAVQNDLFDVGADLATPHDARAHDPDKGHLRITPAQVARIERDIDRFNAQLQPLRSFVLPGGAPAAAYLHLARAVARRAERQITELSASETVNPAALHYINRVSDLLFVLARIVNDGGKGDVLWKPGMNRGE